MFVCELDRPWVETPFLFQGFEIHTNDELEELTHLCQYVFIDDGRGDDAVITPRGPAPTAPRIVQEHTRSRKQPSSFTVLKKFSHGRVPPPTYPDTATLEQEVPRAKEIVQQSRNLVFSMMDDARLGHALDTARAKNTVNHMVESILGNPDALMCFNQLKKKDEYTATHSLRVCVLALAFGRHLGFTPQELNLLGIGALLHDIGKTKVPIDILNKPGKLDEKEFEIMRRHVPFGVEILEKNRGIPLPSIEVAKLHHERFNGHGYATGLRGEAIGLFGSIGAIVDCYDAITSDRSYHDAMSSHEALRKMYSWRRKDFHPRLLEQFIKCMGIYPIGSVVEMNTGDVGVVVSINRTRRLRPRVALVLGSDKKPYPQVTIIDLLDYPEEGQTRRVEIRKVLPPGTHGIVGTDFIPVTLDDLK